MKTITTNIAVQNAYSKASYMNKTQTAEGIERVRELTPDEEMAVFKKEFYADLNKIIIHSSIENAAVNISEKAFQAMKDDPEYREKILSLIQRDLGGSYYRPGVPDLASVVITVGETSEDYRGDSWPTCNNSEYFAKSGKSFWKKRTSGNNGAKDTSYQEIAAKKLAEKRLQEKRLSDKDYEEKIQDKKLEQLVQRKKALEKYENNIIIVTAQD